MKIAVHDANVLIDLANGGFLAAWFDLGIETHTTDLVFSEIRDARQQRMVSPFVRKNLLLIHPCDEAALINAIDLSTRHGVSISDASALALAATLEATLLTGDGRLRKIAPTMQVEARGLLRMLDLLVEQSVMLPRAVAAGLRKIQEQHSFLPAAECESRLKRWES